MTEATLNFTYEGSTIKIQCKRNEYMKDIFKRYTIKISKDANDVYFMCNGSKINEASKLEEISNSDNEISILVYDLNNKKNENKEEQLKKYKDIICNNCNKNKYEIYKNQLYKCCTCKINICPICKTKHDKDHILIDYELKNYLCNVHGEKYILYCKECNKNLCDLCEMEHNDHNYCSLNKLITNKENNIDELKTKIDDLKKEVNGIISTLNKIVDNMEIYYNINQNIINNYNIKNKNYEVLTNITNIYNYNEIIIKDINEIIDENKIENKIKYLYSIYDKMITKNEIIIKYKIGNEDDDKNEDKDEGEDEDENEVEDENEDKDEDEDKIRIFGDEFVENNKDNFKMIINENYYELDSFYNIKNEKENGILEIKLKQIKGITNISHMFSECSNLIELKDIPKMNINNVTNMSYMFNKCRLLSSFPDISKWNTNNINDMSYMFNKCCKLSSLPDISKWNTNNANNISAMFQLCSSLTELPDICGKFADTIMNFIASF